MIKIIQRTIVIVSIMISLTDQVLAQVPNLGRAGSFSFFTTAGAFTNGGATNITGNIGTHAGALTGFPPGTINGQIHIADSVTAGASADLGVAYTYMSSILCDTVIGTTLGNGQILTPRVYCIGAATTLTGNLILNGQGNPNSVFIIKITGALSATSFSSVTLTNSANHLNVYWQIDGAFTLADSSVFRGSMLGNGAITLLNGSTLFGRALTRQGAVNLSSSYNQLPVNLLYFTSDCEKNKVRLSWSTASEMNNDYFTVERVFNDDNWQVAGIVKGEINSSTIKEYSFTDYVSSGRVAYYRLKQTDRDGNYTYFNSIAACGRILENNTLVVSPNPANGIFQLTFDKELSSIQSIEVYNLSGLLIYKTQKDFSAINLSDKVNGVYLLHIQSADGSIIRKIHIDK